MVDKRDIFVTGLDNVVRPVTVTLDPRVAYGAYWRVSRQDAKRITGCTRLLRGNYYCVKIQGYLYMLNRTEYTTYSGRRQSSYFLHRYKSFAPCLKVPADTE